MIFAQLHTIYGVYRKDVLPLVCVLIADKQQQTYQRLINKLRHLCPSYNPKIITIDFEKAAINTLHGTFIITINLVTV